MDQQDRPKPARSPRLRTVGARLTIAIALTVAVVISVLTFGGMRIAERQLDGDLRETAQVAGIAIADEIELQQERPDADVLAPILKDFMDAGADLRSISVFYADGNEPVLAASTAAFLALPPGVVEKAISTGDQNWVDLPAQSATVTVPVRRDANVIGAVSVVVSLGGVDRLRRTARLFAVGGVLAAVVGITLVIHLLARRLVLVPLSEIHRTMSKVRSGDLKARVTVDRRDELGELATDLNLMLTELDGLDGALRERVSLATKELRERNEQLVRSYESVLGLREEVARAQQLAAVGQTMAEVAHQIGTPLNLVSGHVQLLQREVIGTGASRRLQIIAEQVTRVAASVRDLLGQSKPEAVISSVDVERLLKRLANTIRMHLQTAKIRLELKMDQPLPPVRANETQIELALLNLVTNAVDAMPEGGTVTVAATLTDSGLQIEVRDTGTGISPDLLPRIFDPWVTTKPPGRGTGLGLSIARDVVRGVGGTIQVTSLPNMGTTFIINLPADVTVQQT